MIKIEKTSYKGLRKLSLSERMKAIQNPNVGQFLFSALTPTQYAELFPRYYRDQLPDVGMLALPSSTSKMRQAAVADERVRQAAEESDTGILGKIKQKLGLGKTALVTKPGITAPPQLTPEDLMTYNGIKNQPMAADDPKTKFLPVVLSPNTRAANCPIAAAAAGIFFCISSMLSFAGLIGVMPRLTP